MSRFGDLLRGASAPAPTPEPVVEAAPAPEPVVEAAPAPEPVVEAAPEPVVEPVAEVELKKPAPLKNASKPSLRRIK